jgi:RES domain-containing protein
MRLWRISDHASLSGDGGVFFSARWHNRGKRIVYLADHPAAALLEVIVHLEVGAENMPYGYQLLKVDAPDNLRIDEADPGVLPADWKTRLSLTRNIGDVWLNEGSAALLRVPSAIVPEASNYLLNPGHADAARIVIASAMRAAFDPRLIGFVSS